MSSILQVDQIQLADGSVPTAADLGFAAGSVLQEVFFKQQTSTNMVSSNNPSFNSPTYSSLGSTSTRTFTKKRSDSILLIESVVHAYAQQSGSAGQWISVHQRIKVNGTVVRSTSDSNTGDTYGSGYNSPGSSSVGRFMHYNTITAEVSDIASGSVTVSIEGATEASNTSADVHFNTYGQGHIRITEIAG